MNLVTFSDPGDERAGEDDERAAPRRRLVVDARLAIDEAELHERFVRSPGPGGQNVNKVATAVQLRFDAAHSPSLPEDVRARLVALAGARATRAGEIVIEARRFRERERNRADARARLVDLVRRAATPPRPRRKTRPTRASVARRLEAKRHRAEVKRTRRDRGDPE